MKHKTLASIMIILSILAFVACSGPEQKKLKFYNKGKALYEKGDYVKAKLEFKNAVHIDPKYVDAHYMLGMIAIKSNDLNGAYRSFSKVVELSPAYWDAFCSAPAERMTPWRRLNCS